MGHQLAGGNSSGWPKLESRTTHRSAFSLPTRVCQSDCRSCMKAIPSPTMSFRSVSAMLASASSSAKKVASSEYSPAPVADCCRRRRCCRRCTGLRLCPAACAGLCSASLPKLASWLVSRLMSRPSAACSVSHPPPSSSSSAIVSPDWCSATASVSCGVLTLGWRPSFFRTGGGSGVARACATPLVCADGSSPKLTRFWSAEALQSQPAGWMKRRFAAWAIATAENRQQRTVWLWISRTPPLTSRTGGAGGARSRPTRPACARHPVWSGTQMWEASKRVKGAAGVPNWSLGPRTSPISRSSNLMYASRSLRQTRTSETWRHPPNPKLAYQLIKNTQAGVLI